LGDPYQTVLAIDTSSRKQSISVVHDGVATNRSEQVEHDHGVVLLRNISLALEDAGVLARDLSLVAVGTGPGTFTGLRVGLATAKAIARATDIPLVGISSLSAMAFGFEQEDVEVFSVTDARRGEVYLGGFRSVADRWRTTVSEAAHGPGHAVEIILERSDESRILVVGNGPDAYSDVFATLPTEVRARTCGANPSIAESVARLGLLKAQGGECDDVVTLEPNYIRPSDAKVPKPFTVRKKR
jgi:tRNA threonylcarbamoyladenosine biosynthesis protein TsaB